MNAPETHTRILNAGEPSGNGRYGTGGSGAGIKHGIAGAGSGVTGSGRWRFWLPVGIVAQAAARFGSDAVEAGRLGPWLAVMAMEGLSLAPLVPCGLPLALGCRKLWRLGYRARRLDHGRRVRRGDGNGDAAGRLLGPVAVAAWAVLLSLPVWIAWLRLARADDCIRQRAGSGAGSPCASPDGRTDGIGYTVTGEPIGGSCHPGKTAPGRLRSGVAGPNGAERRRIWPHGRDWRHRTAQACPGQALAIRAFLCESAAGERA